MQIVIDIPEFALEAIQRYGLTECKPMLVENVSNAIKAGTPLPEHHDRLIIISEDRLKENQINLDFSCQKWISEVGLSNATVAII